LNRGRLKRAALALVALVALPGLGFPLAGWIGSSIPVNSGWSEPARGVTIMVETNGVHTGIIVPLVTVQKDWRETFPSASIPRADRQNPTHLAIGWGEREVFLNVGEWSDLNPSTVLRIAAGKGEPIMRVSNYVRPAPSENHRPLTISEAQYAQLVQAIEAALPAPAPGTTREILRGTYSDDAYYEALGDYTLTTTCNSWVGETLAQAGVPMGRWTPFAGGVMKWIPRPEAGNP
jgi:uncharacterized protein (TIGR02117 family)